MLFWYHPFPESSDFLLTLPLRATPYKCSDPSMPTEVITLIVGVLLSNIAALGVAVWKIGRWTSRIELRLAHIEDNVSEAVAPLINRVETLEERTRELEKEVIRLNAESRHPRD